MQSRQHVADFPHLGIPLECLHSINALRKIISPGFEPRKFTYIGSRHNNQFEATCLKLPKTSIVVCRHGTGLKVDSQPITSFHIVFVESGTLKITNGNDRRLVSPGEAFIYYPGDRTHNSWSAESSGLVIRIEDSCLERLIAGSYRLNIVDHGVNRTFSTSDGVGKASISILKQLCKEASPDNCEPRLPGSRLEDLLHHSIALLIESELAKDPAVGAMEHPPRYLVRALQFIEQNLKEKITLSMLAGISGVSSRTLQITFSKYFNKSPMKFIRDAKLGKAREELQKFSPGEITVMEIAAEWGLFHASNFSKDYRELFGEAPSQTLRHLY